MYCKTDKYKLYGRYLFRSKEYSVPIDERVERVYILDQPLLKIYRLTLLVYQATDSQIVVLA